MPKGHQKPRTQDFMKVVWLESVVNELGKREVVSPMERSTTLEWYIGSFLNTLKLGKMQLQLVAKVNLNLSDYSLEGLRDNFFPIHLDPLLRGRTYQNQKVFDAIIAEKTTKFVKFELIPVDKKGKIDPIKLKRDFKGLLREMVKSGQFDDEVVDETFQCPENQSKLHHFFRMFVIPKRITSDNFDAFYVRHLQSIEEIVVLNEQMFRSMQTIPHDHPTNQIGDGIIASENKIPKHILHEAAHKSNRQLPYALVDTGEVNPEVDYDRHTPQPHKQAKFGLNDMKYQMTPLSDKQFATQMADKHKTLDFLESFCRISPWPLNRLFWINPLAPWRVNPEILLHYFGQKITLYFKFTIFILNYLYLFMFFGLALWIYEFVIWYFTDTTTYYVLFGLRWGFICMIIVWIGLLTYIWDYRMRNFRLATGISTTAKHTERVLFKSKNYERFLTTDEVNAKSQNALIIALKLLVSFVIALLFYGVGFAITIGLFFAKNAVINSSIATENYVYINHNVINFFEIVRMMVWDFIFRRIAVKLMSKFINPKYVEDYQNFLIYLISFFTIFNHFFVLMVIVFFKGSMDHIGCAPLRADNGRSLFAVYLTENPAPNPNPGALSIYSVSGACFFEATVYFKFYLIFRLLWVVGKFILYILLKNRKQKADKILQSKVRAIRQSRDGIYSELNTLIEGQIMLNPISESLDYDTTTLTFVDVN